MVGHDPSLGARDVRKFLARPGIGAAQLGDVGRGARAVAISVRSIGGAQRIADVLGVAHTVADRVEGVRIIDQVRLASHCGMVVVFHLQRRDPGARHHHRAAKAGFLGEALEPALEAEAVDDHQPSASDTLHVFRHRLVGMRIDPGLQQAGDLRLLATDMHGDVLAHRITGHDAQRLTSRFDSLAGGDRHQQHE